MSPVEPKACFPPAPQSVGLLLTYRCTAACDDCCFECSPQRREDLPLERALELVDGLAEMPSVEGITLTGGECFLRYRDLLQIIARAREKGLRTKCVTNGYWATSRKAARAKLQPLVAAGLQVIELSTDDYHLEYVPLARVAHALETAHELGLETHVIVIADRETRGLAGILRELDLSFEPEVAREFPLLPIGFAATRIPASRLRLRQGLPAGRCADAIRRPAVSPNGEIYSCCAVAGFVPALKLGDLGAEPLKALFDRARDHPLFMVLSLDGPSKLAEIAERRGVFDPRQSFVDECHLCRTLLGDEKVAMALRDELERNQLCYFLRRDFAESALPGLVSNVGGGEPGEGILERNAVPMRGGSIADPSRRFGEEAPPHERGCYEH